MSNSGKLSKMFEIVRTELLAPDIRRFEVVASRIARKRQAGQFVIVRLHEHGERIPLTIVDADVDSETISLVVQGVGKTTRLMNRLEPGDSILDVVGPLGRATEVGHRGTVAVIGGGVGIAVAYPVAEAFKRAGNHVISVIGARTREQVILVEEMRRTSDELFVTTEDGCHGRKGLVTDSLNDLIDAGRRLDLVHAAGPIPMMHAVAETTRPHGISTLVSLNPIMVDGTGMCGGCRVLIDGQTLFACVDGPEFDAHLVDFETLAQRNSAYRCAEVQALGGVLAHPQNNLEQVRQQGESRCRLEEEHSDVARIGPSKS